MLPFLGAAPTPHSNIGDISGKYKRISTKFCVLTQIKGPWQFSYIYHFIESPINVFIDMFGNK